MAAITELLDSGQWVMVEPVGAPQAGRPELLASSDILVMAQPAWEAETRKAVGEVEQYHKTYPLRRGMPREELKSRLKHTPRLFNAAMRRWLGEGFFMESGPLVFSPTHQIRLSGVQQAQVDRLLAKFAANPYNPPSVKDSLAELGDDLYAALLETGELVQVSPEVVFRKTGNGGDGPVRGPAFRRAAQPDPGPIPGPVWHQPQVCPGLSRIPGCPGRHRP